ncbi:MAG: TonB-dependent receptor [Rudanella sp.]|nr:TonB-dependent receptor [Rudanella sp.]
MQFIYSLFVLCLMALSATAQVNQSPSMASSQLIRGSVRDSETERPLSGATLSLEDPTQAYPAVSAPNGAFTFGRVPVGRYQLMVRFLGYETQVISEILLESGKEQVVEVRLRAGAQILTETVVKGIRPDNSLGSVQTISPEQILRFPATYLDPARLATAYAGVINTNDQANNISVRGNSPAGLVWRLEGAEIVNPNHLSNAGTIGDRPLPSGGGVTILSAQLLNSTRFLSGAFTPEYGNTLGGLMDMRFREGNNQKHEFTAQAGLIGIDLAAEGPLNRRTGATYLVNYRYSFTGLLGLMGITFGGEAIRFQDLSVNLALPTRRGKLTLFGVMGQSSNNFTAKADSLREEDKDRFSIRFDSWMSAGGLTYTQPLKNHWQWRLSAVASANTNTRDQMPGASVTGGLAGNPFQYDRSTNARATLHNQLTHRARDDRRLQVGLYLTRWYGSAGVWRGTSNLGSVPRAGRVQEGVLGAWLVQPYANYQWTPSEKLRLNAGLHGNLFTLNKNSLSLEPRLSLRWQPIDRHALTLAYGLHSQTQQPIVYLSQPIYQVPNVNNQALGLTKAHHFVAGYTLQINETSSLKAEAYYQALFNVPVAADRGLRPTQEPV